jgi:1,2-diacylglycerol 3-alpha-glucosyltransferase
MKIGIVTNWSEQEIGIISHTYAEALSRYHKLFIYHRSQGQPASVDANWNQYNVTSGKKTRLATSDDIDWNDFKGWVSRNQLDLILFFDQHSWDVVIKCHSLKVIIGAFIDYCSVETLPFFRLFDFLLCSTLRHYNLFREHPQVIYFPWGTNLALFIPNQQPTLHGAVRFLHSAGMGSLGSTKGTDILLRAFKEVRGEVQLTITSQTSLDRSSSMVRSAQSDPRITFIEKVDPDPSLYFLGDVYIYPTRLEGLPLTITEALASGLPVITTNSPPMNEYIREDYNGRLVTVERYEKREDQYYWPESIVWEISLAQAMQYYADHPEQVTLQKAHARQYAEAHLDWKVNSSSLAERVTALKRGSSSLAMRMAASRFEHARLGEDYLAAASYAIRTRQRRTVFDNLLLAVRFAPIKLFDRRVPAMIIQTIISFFIRK